MTNLTMCTYEAMSEDNTHYRSCCLYRLQQCVKVKVKVHTLDIAPLRSESPPQKRSGVCAVCEN